MKRTVIAFLSVLAIALTSAGPASAADELGLSKDGVVFGSSLTNLFDPTFTWVPGDSQSATFWVKNQSTDTASLAIDILGDKAGSLLDSDKLHVTVTGAGGIAIPASGGAAQLVLLAAGIAPGQVVPINVLVDFDFGAGNDTQLLSSDLNFRVTLTQSSVTPPNSVPGRDGNGSGGSTGTDNSGGSDNGSGLLPNTGAPEVLWALVLGSLFLGTGLAFASRRRTTIKGDSHV